MRGRSRAGQWVSQLVKGQVYRRSSVCGGAGDVYFSMCTSSAMTVAKYDWSERWRVIENESVTHDVSW